MSRRTDDIPDFDQILEYQQYIRKYVAERIDKFNQQKLNEVLKMSKVNIMENSPQVLPKLPPKLSDFSEEDLHKLNAEAENNSQLLEILIQKKKSPIDRLIDAI